MEYPTYEFEDIAMSKGYKHICGVDETGYGSLCDVVVAGAVVIPIEVIPLLMNKVNDSKKLSPKKRGELNTLIKETCEYSIGEVDNKYIDQHDILIATKLAMNIAISKLKFVDYLLVDGNFSLPDCPINQQSIIGGDAKSISIAAASIVAKEYRDDLMKSLDKEYPEYGFAQHKGYGTKQHLKAITEYGPCPKHRLTFRRVK